MAGFPFFTEQRTRIAAQRLHARERLAMREAAAHTLAHRLPQGCGFVCVHGSTMPAGQGVRKAELNDKKAAPVSQGGFGENLCVAYLIASSSTSKMSVEFGGMGPPGVPRSP